jgi:hypothetical protein
MARSAVSRVAPHLEHNLDQVRNRNFRQQIDSVGRTTNGTVITRERDYCTAQHTTQRTTAQHSTAQHSTAQHSTAQHSTAQHSTAQHSTAQHTRDRHAPWAASTSRGGCLTVPHGSADGSGDDGSLRWRRQSLRIGITLLCSSIHTHTRSSVKPHRHIETFPARKRDSQRTEASVVAPHRHRQLGCEADRL